MELSEEVLEGHSFFCWVYNSSATLNADKIKITPCLKACISIPPCKCSQYPVLKITVKKVFSFSLFSSISSKGLYPKVSVLPRRVRGRAASVMGTPVTDKVGMCAENPVLCSSHQFCPIHRGKKWMRFDIFNTSNTSTKTLHRVELQELLYE